MTECYQRLQIFANITGGLPEQVNAACVAATTAENRWQCFMAQWTLPQRVYNPRLLPPALSPLNTERILLQVVAEETVFASFDSLFAHLLNAFDLDTSKTRDSP
jgi:hypothetical protein